MSPTEIPCPTSRESSRRPVRVVLEGAMPSAWDYDEDSPRAPAPLPLPPSPIASHPLVAALRFPSQPPPPRICTPIFGVVVSPPWRVRVRPGRGFFSRSKPYFKGSSAFFYEKPDRARF